MVAATGTAQPLCSWTPGCPSPDCCDSTNRHGHPPEGCGAALQGTALLQLPAPPCPPQDWHRCCANRISQCGSRCCSRASPGPRKDPRRRWRRCSGCTCGRALVYNVSSILLWTMHTIVPLDWWLMQMRSSIRRNAAFHDAHSSDPPTICCWLLAVVHAGDAKMAHSSTALADSRTNQWRWRRECRPSLSVISAAFMALGRSCLFANTSSTASRSSSCAQAQCPMHRNYEG